MLMRNQARQKNTNHWLLRNWPRTNLNSRIGAHSSTTDGPSAFIVIHPGDVSVCPGFVLEPIDSEASTTYVLGITLLIDPNQ